MLHRWTLVDTVTSEAWEFPRNPHEMTSPHPPKNTVIFSRSPIGGAGTEGVSRVLQFRQAPYEWSFTGRIRTQAHYDSFVAWTKKTGRLQLTDHLLRTWSIRITAVDLTEERPTARTAWRFEYTVKATIYGRIS